MPETSIDEDGDPPFRESDVGPDEPTFDSDRVVLAESTTGTVQRRAERDLLSSVFAADCRHVSRPAGRRYVST
jgi:hypothetical protein